MRTATTILSGVTVSFAVCGFLWAAEAMPKEIKISDGMLTDAKGMTLYVFDNDKKADKSSCNGMCLMNWPALRPEAGDRDMGAWKIISRDDGSKQWAYKGKPVYYFRMD